MTITCLFADSQEDEPAENFPKIALNQLMKASFDEEYRHSICLLGGLQAIAELLLCYFAVYDVTLDISHIMLRKLACMILINLTFGDGTNKALLCSSMPFLQMLSQFLSSPSEIMRQVVANVLRNLSWKADMTSKQNLRDAKVRCSFLQFSKWIWLFADAIFVLC